MDPIKQRTGGRRVKKTFLWLIPLLLALFLILPGLSGIWFEHTYRNIIAFYNREGNVSIQITNYQRGWFSSRATLSLQVIDPDVKSFLSMMQVNNPQLNFTIQQLIQHGPILLQWQTPPIGRIGLAFIHNQIQNANNQQVISEDDDLVTLLGNYYKNFNIPAFQYTTQDNVSLNFSEGLRGNLRVYPREKRFSGTVFLFNFKANSEDLSLDLPNLTLYFNQAKSPSALWLGQLSLLVPEVDAVSQEESTKVYGIDFDSDSYEYSGKIYDFRRIDIDKIDVGKQTVGPAHLQIRADGLDANAIKEMVAAYRKILAEGERYESQLQYKINMMLPKVFSDASWLRLSTFELHTPIGRVKVEGEMHWPATQTSAPDSISELIDASNAKATVYISEVLTDKLIRIAAKIPYFRKISLARRKELLAMDQDVQLANQQNFLTISWLAQNNFISEDAGVGLLTLQKNHESVKTYLDQVKKLFLNKEITLAASYFLGWKYAAIENSEDAIDQAILLDQENQAQQIRSNLIDWIKAGYITQDRDEYTTTLEKTGETIKINGKAIPNNP